MAAFFMLISLAWALGLWLLFIVAACAIAEAKGRNTTNWGWLALFYGLLAVIAVALMPPLDRRS